MNLKGTSSFQTIDQKPAFRVNINKFVKGARLFGLKEILLNNMVQDRSMIHERLAYWIGRQIGTVPTPRCNHSWVTMNGAVLGLYATVEEAKGTMMANSFSRRDRSALHHQLRRLLHQVPPQLSVPGRHERHDPHHRDDGAR